jgi:PAS domain S-box-containing protein
MLSHLFLLLYFYGIKLYAVSTKFILHNSLDILYCVCDLQGQIITSNDLFKSSVNHIRPKKINDIISNDDLDDFIDVINKSKNNYSDPIRVYSKTIQKNGSLKWVLWNIYFINNTLHFIGIEIRDVNSITQYEYERQKKLIEEFRFMLSHEIRHPLTSIAGLVQLLIKDKVIDQEEFNELLLMLDKCVIDLDQSILKLVKKITKQL